MWFVIKFENYVDIYDIIQYFSTKKKKKNTTSGVFGFPKFPRCCHTTIYKCKHNQKFLYESKICKVKSSIICRPTWTTSKDFHNSNWQLLGNEEKVHSFHTPFFFFFLHLTICINFSSEGHWGIYTLLSWQEGCVFNGSKIKLITLKL